MEKIELQNFCRNVVYIRKKLNLSKTSMAKLMGIGMCTYNKIENGIVTSRVNVLVLCAMYNNFGVSPNVLMYDDTEQIDRELCYHREQNKTTILC